MTRPSDNFFPAAKPGKPSDAFFPSSPTIGPDTPYAPKNAGLDTARLYQQAVEKWRAGKPLTAEESQALIDMKATGKSLDKVGKALQPFLFLSDLTTGLIGEAQSTGG